MEKRKIMFLSSLCLLCAALVFAASSTQTPEVIQVPVTESQIYHANVIATKIDGLTGKCTVLSDSPNLLTDAGKTLLTNYLNNVSTTSLNAVRYIAIGNGTATVAGSTTLDSEIVGCGLDRAISTDSYNNGTTGCWVHSKVFTSNASCASVKVNTTALFNQTATGTLFAGNTLSSDATLTGTNGDQLNITWIYCFT